MLKRLQVLLSIVCSNLRLLNLVSRCRENWIVAIHNIHESWRESRILPIRVHIIWWRFWGPLSGVGFQLIILNSVSFHHVVNLSSQFFVIEDLLDILYIIDVVKERLVRFLINLSILALPGIHCRFWPVSLHSLGHYWFLKEIRLYQLKFRRRSDFGLSQDFSNEMRHLVFL